VVTYADVAAYAAILVDVLSMEGER